MDTCTPEARYVWPMCPCRGISRIDLRNTYITHHFLLPTIAAQPGQHAGIACNGMHLMGIICLRYMLKLSYKRWGAKSIPASGGHDFASRPILAQILLPER